MKNILFAGSFDPITNAHIDIIKRTLKLGYKVYVGILNNSSKTYMFDQQMRKEMLELVIKNNNLENVEVFVSDKALVDECIERDIEIVVRGLRNLKDFEYEKDMEINNKLLNNNLEYIYLSTEPKLSHVSSTVVRELINMKKDVSHLVPAEVENVIKNS